tara:strand:+ start:198 stop:1574 length:1377 start_codon:yes stop_codon:yes gene_type:complete
MNKYTNFLQSKAQHSDGGGFQANWLPEFLFDFQRDLVEWATLRGRAAIFADCGLGKTPMQLVWAENIVRHTNKPVLVVTPLAVSYQIVEEAKKFGIDAIRVSDGNIPSGSRVIVTNYERLHLFDSTDFSGVSCDESSILKNFNGTRRAIVTEFMRTLQYRLLCTATAAPNDYIELGTSSEALGELGYMDMLTRFFRNARNTSTSQGREFGKAVDWRLKGHAEIPFWKWVSSWARAIRKPSDYGYDDAGFILPPLKENKHVIEAQTTRPGWLFDQPAITLDEQRLERKRTIKERCAKVAELCESTDQSLVWCHLNDEGNLLTNLIDGAVQVSGSDSDEKKEENLMAFANGDIRVLVTKPKIGAFGLNLQSCSHVTFFPSHSYEQYYQGIRRCWRFGQTQPVVVDVVATEGDSRVIDNLYRKSVRADEMFTSLIQHMTDTLQIERTNNNHNTEMEIPKWL